MTRPRVCWPTIKVAFGRRSTVCWCRCEAVVGAVGRRPALLAAAPDSGPDYRRTRPSRLPLLTAWTPPATLARFAGKQAGLRSFAPNSSRGLKPRAQWANYRTRPRFARRRQALCMRLGRRQSGSILINGGAIKQLSPPQGS